MPIQWAPASILKCVRSRAGSQACIKAGPLILIVIGLWIAYGQLNTGQDPDPDSDERTTSC